MNSLILDSISFMQLHP